MPTTTLPPPGPGGPPAHLAPSVPAAGTRPPPRPGCGRPRGPRFDRRLRRRQAGDRDAVGRAAHVVHAGAMAEAYRARFTPVLAADADLEARVRGAAALDGPKHELADALLVQGLERIFGEDAEPPLVHVVRQEAPGVIARQGHGHLRQIVGPER